MELISGIKGLRKQRNKMEENLSKSIRNGLYVWLFFILISISFGVYDMATGIEEFSPINVVLTIVGAILATVIFFVLGFVVSLIFYYYKEKGEK